MGPLQQALRMARGPPDVRNLHTSSRDAAVHEDTFRCDTAGALVADTALGPVTLASSPASHAAWAP